MEKERNGQGDGTVATVPEHGKEDKRRESIH